MDRIDHFDTYWLCFSNFAAAPTSYEGRLYPTSEHAYQAAKVLDRENKELVASAPTPNKAKELGQKYRDHPNWDEVKIAVMTDIVRAKFTQNDDMARILLSTGDAILEEGNHWRDSFWGIYQRVGENQLGKVLMAVRSELRAAQGGDFSWSTLAGGLLLHLKDLPLDALKVYEKIGEELGEFQDEIIKQKSYHDLAEEAVDVLVTSMAAVEAFLRYGQSGSKVVESASSLQWPTPANHASAQTVHNVFQAAQTRLPAFLSAYGRLAKAQRKWRSKPAHETRSLYLSSALELATEAFSMASSLQTSETLVSTYTRKVDKWRGYPQGGGVKTSGLI